MYGDYKSHAPLVLLPPPSLLLRFNSRKYLLGLTHTLAQDCAASRLKPDYVILPSLPYHPAHGLFLWHLPVLPPSISRP
jgi:hypothetical protein